METRQQGGGSFPTYNLDTGGLVDDDFPFLDPNLTSIDTDFSSFLDSTSQNFDVTTSLVSPQSAAPNGSLLPADEWSGTTNTMPDTPSSHQQLQHGLEGSSPLQSQLQAAQPVLQANKQQQFVFENHIAGTSQTNPEMGGNQQNALASDQMDVLSSQVTHQQPRANMQPGLNVKLENQGAARQPSYSNRQVLLNGSTSFSSQQSLSQAPAGGTAREMGLQSPSFHSSVQQPEPTGLQSTFGGQPQRTYENLQGRQVSANPGFQGGQIESSQGGFRMSFPRGLMMNGHLGMPGANTAQQMTIQGQQGSLNHMQGSDPDGNPVVLQSQLVNNQVNFPGHANALQSSQFMAKANARQSLLQGHALNSHLPSFQLQPSSHQIQLQGQTKLHPQVITNQQAINQGLLQSRQVQLGSQQSVFPSAQQPSYQLLQPQGYQMHPNSGAHLPMGRQMLSQMQPRLQNQLLQGLRLGGRQLGQQFIGGPQIAAGPAEAAARYPVPGTNAAKCAQVFMLYIQEQRKRPSDNNIIFWKNLVHKFFAPGATKRWCLTSYSTTPVGRHAQGLFPMDYWYCNLCGIQPGRGFESGTDVLPRLFKIKYDSGLLDELLFLDIATEKYSLPSGKVVLEYSRAVHESVFLELRVIRHGKLRVTFNSSFKICSWEFCTKAHEEVVPRKNLLQQVHQLASLVIEADQENFDKSADNLKSHCNAFTKAAKQLAVQLDAPMVNDLGFSKRYVRCLQIAEVVNSMKDLVSFERKTGLGPIESLARFPTVKKLQMEGALTGLPPSLSLTQMISELTQGPPSLQSSTVTRLHSESLSEAQEQAANQAQSSVLKGTEASMPVSLNPSQQRNQMDTRLQQLLQAQAYGQIQMAPAQTQSGQVQSHSMNQLSQLTAQGQAQTLSQTVATQGLSQQAPNSNQIGQQNYQQVVLKSGAAKSSLSQPQSVNQTSLPGTPQSEMSDMRSNT